MLNLGKAKWSLYSPLKNVKRIFVSSMVLLVLNRYLKALVVLVLGEAQKLLVSKQKPFINNCN